MGKQSSRMYYQGKDHKDIYFQGHYHDKMYIGSQLVWEKLKEKGWIFVELGTTYYGATGNGQFLIIGNTKQDTSSKTRYFELFSSVDCVVWNKHEYTISYHFYTSKLFITDMFFFNGYFYILTYDFGYNHNGEYDESSVFRTKDGSSIESVSFSEMNFSIFGRNLSVIENQTLPYINWLQDSIEVIDEKALIKVTITNNTNDSIFYHANNRFYFESTDFKNWTAKGVCETAYTLQNTAYTKMVYPDILFAYIISTSTSFSTITTINGYYYGVGGKTDHGGRISYKEAKFIRTKDFHNYEVIDVPSFAEPYRYSSFAKIGRFYECSFFIDNVRRYVYTEDYNSFYVDDLSHFISIGEDSSCKGLIPQTGADGKDYSVYYPFFSSTSVNSCAVVVDKNGNVIDESKEYEILSPNYDTGNGYYRVLCIGNTFVISYGYSYAKYVNGIYYRKLEE